MEEENLYMTNEKVRLQCQAKGYPVPTIVWQYVDEFDKLIETSTSSNLFQVCGIDDCSSNYSEQALR